MSPQSATLHWADGRVWHVFLEPNADHEWHFTSDGHTPLFSAIGQI